MTTKQDAIKLALEKLNEFDAKTGCLSHPEVPYHGTANGDSEEAWQARMNQARLNILSASISEASQPVQDGDANQHAANLKTIAEIVEMGFPLHSSRPGQLREASEFIKALSQSAQPSDKPFTPDWTNYHQGISDGWLNAADWLNDNYQDHITVADVVSQMREEARAWAQPSDKTFTKVTVGELAMRVGARETKDGEIIFGSWMALSAFYTHAVRSLIDQLPSQAVAPAQAMPVPSNQNVDVGYFTKKLNLVVRDLHSYTADELQRELSRLANAAAPQPKQEQSGTDTQERDDVKPRLKREQLFATAEKSGFVRIKQCCDGVDFKTCSGDEWKGDIAVFAGEIYRLAHQQQESK